MNTSSTTNVSLEQARTLLTGQAFGLMTACQVVGISAMVYPPMLSVYLGLSLVVAVALLWDRGTLPSGSLGELQWSGPDTLELGAEQSYNTVFAFAPALAAALRPRTLTLTLPPWQKLRLKSPDSSLVVGRDEGPVPKLLVAMQLGLQELGNADLTFASRWRFWRRQDRAAISGAAVRVVPSAQQVNTQQFIDAAAKQRQLFSGMRQLTRNRSNDQFYTTRPYSFPDPWRHIDHKKSARYGQWMTRTYEAFRSHHLVILCDFGRAMVGMQAGSTKLDFYLAAAEKLAANALASHDTVSFCGFGQSVVHMVKRARRIGDLQGLWQGNERFRAAPEESDYELIPLTLQQITSQRALVLVLTDVNRPSVQQSLLSVLQPVCRRHAVVAVGLLDRHYALNERLAALPTQPTVADVGDWQNAELIYSYWLNGEFARFQEQMTRMGAATFTGVEGSWLDLVTRVYALLRLSLHA